MVVWKLCLMVLGLALLGCAGRSFQTRAVAPTAHSPMNSVRDASLRERLLIHIRNAQEELNALAVQAERQGVREGIEVRANKLPKRFPVRVIQETLAVQARLDALLLQYAVQYGVQRIWCEDPSRGRMPFVGMPRYEDLEHYVQCMVADTAYPGGRRIIEPYITIDPSQRSEASALFGNGYETARYPLPPPSVVPSPIRRPVVCRLADE